MEKKELNKIYEELRRQRTKIEVMNKALGSIAGWNDVLLIDVIDQLDAINLKEIEEEEKTSKIEENNQTMTRE